MNNPFFPPGQNNPNFPMFPNMQTIPDYQQLWNAFVTIHQQQQQMMQMFYMKLFYDYQRFCSVRNLDYKTQYAFGLYYKFKYNIDVFPQNPSIQNQNNSTIYITEKLEEKLPRPDSNDNAQNQPHNQPHIQPQNQIFQDPNLMNIAFVTNAGYRVALNVPNNTTILQMCQMYMDKLNLPRYYIGNDVQFLYNAKLIDPFSEETVLNKFKVNSIHITVLDQAGVVGAF